MYSEYSIVSADGFIGCLIIIFKNVKRYFSSIQTHPGTPKSVANITGNGHRFLRKNTAKVRPSGQNLPGSRNSGDGTGSKSLKSKTNNSNQEWDNSTSVTSNNTVTINVTGKRRSSQSKTSILLASIPLCTTQKCLIKYGCSHC